MRSERQVIKLAVHNNLVSCLLDNIMPTTHRQGNYNPLVIISRDEFHKWLRSMVDQTEYKEHTMSAVQFTFADTDGKITNVINMPDDIVVMVSNMETSNV